MKYNIEKLQQGGGFATFTPIARVAPTAPTGGTGQPTEKAKSEEDSIIDKKLYEKLVSDGLFNDVSYLIDKIAKVESSPLAYMDKSNISSSLQLIKEFNRVFQNKEIWKETYKNAQTLGGFGEVAVGKQGEIFVRDKDSFKAITLEEYKKNKEKYNPLTVSELLRARQFDPKLTYNDTIFQVGETAYGTNNILKKIQDSIKLIEADSERSEVHRSRGDLQKELMAIGVNKTPNEQQQQALVQMLRTPGEQYKIVNASKGKGRYKQVAYDYLISSLTQEERNKLRAVATINNITLDDLLEDSLNVGLSGQEISTEISPEKIGAGETTDEKGLRSLTQFQMFHKDKLATPNTTFAQNDPKFSTMFRGMVGGVSPIISPEGESVGMTTVGNILNKGYNQLVKGDEVYFGKKKVPQTSLNNLIYDGQDAAKVYMPVDTNGDPDFDSLEEFKDIYTVYEANKDIWSVPQAESYFKKYGYNLKIDETYENGKKEKVIRDNMYVKPFLLMYGYTNDATGLTDDNEDFLTKLSKDEESAVVPLLKQVWTVGTGKNVQNLTPESFWNIEEYYKGLVAIPYRKEATAIVDAMVGQGPKEKVSSIVDVQRNLLYSSNQSLASDTSALSLKPKI